MQVLVIGGFGFVGGRIASEIARAGHHVLLGSRREVGAPAWLPRAAVIRVHWYDEAALEQVCAGVDVVIHAAGMNASDCAADPEAALEVNGEHTRRVANAAARAGVKHFIYFSTAHVYSGTLIGTITEDTAPSNHHPYATSHLVGEAAVAHVTEFSAMQGTIIRLSNAYGAPMQRDTNCWMLLINDLCRQAAQSGKLICHSDGSQHRDFICMREVSRVVRLLMEGEAVDSQLYLFNVGLGRSQSVLDLALVVQRRCNFVLGINPPLKLREGQPPKRQVKELFYQSNHLPALGIHIENHNMIPEIDRLLKFCKENFSAL